MPIEIDPPQIENLWKLNLVGIVDETYSPEEKLAVENFESNIICIGSTILTNPFAVISDISKAFLRIGINFNSRDYCRFLWFENSNLNKIVTYRFKVVMFGATCSPFLLQKTIVYHLEHNSDPLASQLIPHFYVDNFYVTEVEINVLGINWNVTHDSLSIKSSQYVCKNECLHHHLTKRQVVSIVSSIFDPLVSTITFPRFAIIPGNCHLHIFADASKQAYGLAVYVVTLCSSNLLLSKARVAPRPKLSIPKLELTALNLGSKMAKSLMSNSALAFQSCTLRTDSEVVLHWVHHNKCTDVYVRNRVKDIHDGEFPSKYVPTKENPADLVTCGVSFKTSE
ncbi:uncharacterized protein [Palaemon carinicauda]|uniref:uncharacterized protein n=1 Tax=Palaemon carinicauda TaxID=392227 RepID=UPI0035B69EBE